MSRSSRAHRLTDEDKAGMREYWQFYEPISAVVSDEIRRVLADIPEWGTILRAMSPAQIEEQDEHSKQLQREAIMHDRWAGYLADLEEQGVRYARMGVEFEAWYDVIAIYRDVLRKHVAALLRDRPAESARAMRILDGLNRFTDLAMSNLGRAYLAEKQTVIANQRDAIRELSVPVLQVRDRLLVIPIIGIVDTSRAQQLMENMLSAVRDRRAFGIVVDVTGVPIIDTAVAERLAKTFEAARMMGAQVVVSGISAEIAQALVHVGSDRLMNAKTFVDLQDALAEFEEAILDRHTRTPISVPSVA